LIPLERSVAYLESEEARESLRADPYWPKWDSPWWHMTLLWELDMPGLIPKSAVETMVEVLRGHFLPYFPIRPEELPPETDPYRQTACHCGLGTMHQVLSACGVAVDAELPWIGEWLLRYQLPDGGLNCEWDAYTRSQKSSVVSTLPALEAILAKPAHDALELKFLDDGADYLLSKKLFRSSTGSVIQEDWLKLCFPRFFDYDILRGLSFLRKWSRKLGRPLPEGAIAESVAIIEKKAAAGGLRVERIACSSDTSITRDESGLWRRGMPARRFALLDEVSRIGRQSPELDALWAAAR